MCPQGTKMGELPAAPLFPAPRRQHHRAGTMQGPDRRARRFWPGIPQHTSGLPQCTQAGNGVSVAPCEPLPLAHARAREGAHHGGPDLWCCDGTEACAQDVLRWVLLGGRPHVLQRTVHDFLHVGCMQRVGACHGTSVHRKGWWAHAAHACTCMHARTHARTHAHTHASVHART